MENLFVYGTLKNSEVLKLIIDRVPESKKDSIVGYSLKTIEIDSDVYPLLVEDPKQKKPVEGLVISVSSEELKKIDKHETEAYKRKEVVLKSGEKVFVYLANPI